MFDEWKFNLDNTQTIVTRIFQLKLYILSFKLKHWNSLCITIAVNNITVSKFNPSNYNLT